MLLGSNLGGGGDALAKFEPKDVPTMSMMLTLVLAQIQILAYIIEY